MQVQQRFPMLERQFNLPPQTIDRPDDRRGPDVAAHVGDIPPVLEPSEGTPRLAAGPWLAGDLDGPCGGGARRPRRASDRRSGGRAVCLPGHQRHPDRRRCGGDSAAGGGPPAAGTAPHRWKPDTCTPLHNRLRKYACWSAIWRRAGRQK